MDFGQPIGKCPHVGGRHGRDPVQVRLHQNVAAIEQYARAIGNALVGNFYGLHFGIEIKRKSAVTSAGIMEAKSLDLDLAVPAVVGGRLHVRKSVFLEHSSVGERGGRRIRAGFCATLALLPSVECRRKNRRTWLSIRRTPW